MIPGRLADAVSLNHWKGDRENRWQARGADFMFTVYASFLGALECARIIVEVGMIAMTVTGSDTMSFIMTIDIMVQNVFLVDIIRI